MAVFETFLCITCHIKASFSFPKIIPKTTQMHTNLSFFITLRKHGDHEYLEWSMLSYYVIYCQNLIKIIQQTEK